MNAYFSRHEEGLIKLAQAILDAKDRHRQACMNGNTMAQVGANQRIDDLEYAFALITGTAVGGMHFKDEFDRIVRALQTKEANRDG